MEKKLQNTSEIAKNGPNKEKTEQSRKVLHATSAHKVRTIEQKTIN